MILGSLTCAGKNHCSHFKLPWILRLRAVVGKMYHPQLVFWCGPACHGVVIVTGPNPEAEKLWLLCFEAFSWWPPTYHKAGS